MVSLAGTGRILRALRLGSLPDWRAVSWLIFIILSNHWILQIAEIGTAIVFASPYPLLLLLSLTRGTVMGHPRLLNRRGERRRGSTCRSKSVAFTIVNAI
jgi:hypothetical protein